MRAVQVHEPGRGVREQLAAAVLWGLQGGQVRLSAACLQLCCSTLCHCSADTARPGRYCSSECQKAAWKRGGHREACRSFKQAAGEEPA